MALDSKGNQAVDFVWGNTPLQPNTDRKTSVAPVTALLAYADEKSGKQRFYANDLPADFVAGASFEVSGFLQTELNRKYVIDTVEVQTPGGYIKTTTPYIAYEGMMSPPSNNTIATIDPSENIGGGEGDYGWSKTTKKKSVQLDPTLDSHNITTEFWNNFPGYTPNVGFVPQEVFSFEVANPWSVTISVDQPYDNPYNSTAHGYIITIYSNGISSGAQIELKDLIVAGSLAGERVPATPFQDAYGNTLTAPEGWIVGADYSPDSYGGYSFTIQVATAPNAWTRYSDYAAVGNVFTLGIGAPKDVLWQGVNGVDYDVAFVRGAPYGGQPAGFEIRKNMFNSAADLSELVAHVNSGALVGSWIGLGIIDENNPSNFGYAYYHKRNLIKVGQARVENDGYGNDVVFVQAADDISQWWSAEDFQDYVDGDTIVIIK